MYNIIQGISKKGSVHSIDLASSSRREGESGDEAHLTHNPDKQSHKAQITGFDVCSYTYNVFRVCLMPADTSR